MAGKPKDMSGVSLGIFVVQYITSKRRNGSVVWACQCTRCGGILERTQKQIYSNQVPVCPTCVPVDDYALGIIWATATINDASNTGILSNSDPHFANEIARQAGGTVYTLIHERNGTLLHCVKLRKPLVNYAQSLGWTGRSNLERGFPPHRRSFCICPFIYTVPLLT